LFRRAKDLLLPNTIPYAGGKRLKNCSFIVLELRAVALDPAFWDE